MPLSYEYYCPANGKTFSLQHGMQEEIKTWAELCQRLDLLDSSAEPTAEVHRVISGGVLALPRRVSKEAPREDLDAILCGPGDQCIPCCPPAAGKKEES